MGHLIILVAIISIVGIALYPVLNKLLKKAKKFKQKVDEGK
jgi:5,10-methylenetetrahydrofolate reductase